jgi:hypothetical protein
MLSCASTESGSRLQPLRPIMHKKSSKAPQATWQRFRIPSNLLETMRNKEGMFRAALRNWSNRAYPQVRYLVTPWSRLHHISPFNPGPYVPAGFGVSLPSNILTLPW